MHLFTDGRDTGPFTGLGYARRVESRCAEIGIGRVASVMGRYYAMDRDHRWERVKLAYDCLVGRGGASFPTAAEALQHAYDHPSGETLKGDEFVPPTAIGTPEEVRNSRLRDDDSVIFYNYRGDRPRELCAAFVFPDAQWSKVKPSPDSGVAGFDRGRQLKLHFVTMTDYWEALTPHVTGVAFPRPPQMVNTGGEWISRQNMAQFRCAETEKYPHVTFFFNDYREAPWPGESRVNPPSPKVKTYDMQPEMSADAVCAAALSRIQDPAGEPFLVVNFANADMVGHTGNLDAAVKACEKVDHCVGVLVDAALARGGAALVFADHGNAEQMWDPITKAPHTAHTLYDVPLILVSEMHRGRRLRGDRDPAGWFRPESRAVRGRLADVLPTALDVMGLRKPEEMTGESLLA